MCLLGAQSPKTCTSGKVGVNVSVEWVSVSVRPPCDELATCPDAWYYTAGIRCIHAP